MLQIVVVFSILLIVNGQRSPYAGSRPASGYKDTYITPVSPNGQSSTQNIVNRLDVTTGTPGAGAPSSGATQSSAGLPTTNQRLPYDAYGDQYIVDYWHSQPVDKRPFWLVNQAHIEGHRGSPATTVSGAPSSPASGTLDNRFGETTLNNMNNMNRITTPGQPEIVFPSNLTPDQRLQLEINILQQRLQFLQERQRQQQAQQTTQSIPMISNPGRRF